MDFKKQFSEMAKEITSGGVSDDAARVLLLAQEHFNFKRDQLMTVLAYRDKPIRFCADGEEKGGDPVIEPGTDLHKGFITGIEVALNYIGEFPVTVSECGVEDED